MKSQSNILHVWPMPAAMKLRRAFRPLLFRLWHPLHLYANRKPGRVRLGELELCTDPRVFNPAQHFSSRILAEQVAQLDLKGRHVLDVGTGSGVIGLTAARQGAEVVALDLNPYAAALAKKNALANGFRSQFKVLCGDLLDSLYASTRFDWIIFNPPFYARTAAGLLQAAYHAGAQNETLVRFLQHAPAFLAPGGKILMILSSDMNAAEMRHLLARQPCAIMDVEIKPHFFEVFYFVQLAK